MKLDHQLIPYTQISSRWIKDLNISCDTIKVLEENIGGKISDMPHSNIFANISPRVREIKGKNKQMGLHQTKKFLHSKGNCQQSEEITYQMAEDIHQQYI